jgi:sporulation integral membrane protein YlbJ
MPFLMLSEFMIGFGLVHFLGTLVEPVMRPIFRLPGCAGFVLALGFASGYPVAAKLSAQLVKQNELTQKQAERLVGFATTADPIFITSAVALGFLKQPQLASLLLAGHFSSAVLLGFLLRFTAPPMSKEKPKPNRLVKAIQHMHQARMNDGRSFGQLAFDATERALSLLFLIGGFVVAFAILLSFIPFQNVNSPLIKPLIGTLFEVTLGAKSIADVQHQMNLGISLGLLAFAIAWGGLSVHLQIIGITSQAKLRYTPFLFARFIHGLLSSGITFLIWLLFIK